MMVPDRLLFLASIGALIFLSGCSSYRAQPVDLTAFDQAWRTRSPHDAAVANYITYVQQHGADVSTTVTVEDGISLSEAEILALVFNPQLHAARVRAGVAVINAAGAGRWEDPAINIDVLRALESGPSPWTVLSGLSLTLPLSGRLGLAKTHAELVAESDRLAVIATEWAHCAVLRETWVTWSATKERQRITEQFAKDITALGIIADELHKAGEISVIAARAVRIAAVQAQLTAQQLAAEAEQQALTIRALMGFSPQAPVQLVPSLILPIDEQAHIPQSVSITANAQVQIALARHQATEAALRLEIRKQYPDLQLGFAYENDRGDKSLGPSFGFTIPLWHGNAPAIANATAQRDADSAEIQAAYVAAIHDWEQAQLTVRDRSDRLHTLQQQVVPLIDSQVADVQHLAELGDLDVSLVLSVLDEVWKIRNDIVEIQAERTYAENRLLALHMPTWLTQQNQQSAAETQP